MEEDSLFRSFGRRICRKLSSEIVSDCKVEDWAEEGFLVASHDEAVEEGADLGIDRLFFGVESMDSVYHAENEAAQDARGVGAVRGKVHVKVLWFVVEGVRHTSVFDC